MVPAIFKNSTALNGVALNNVINLTMNYYMFVFSPKGKYIP